MDDNGNKGGSGLLSTALNMGFKFLSAKAILIIIVVIIVVILLAGIILIIFFTASSSSINYATENATFPLPIVSEEITVTSLFSNRISPITGELEYHLGIDLCGEDGCDVIAVYDGVVTTSTYNSSYGNTVVIEHTLDIDGDGEEDTVYTRVAHMRDTPLVNVGDEVVQGQVLGYQGSTGDSTGPHCHFEVCINSKSTRTNPDKYLGLEGVEAGTVIHVDLSDEEETEEDTENILE